MNVIQKYLDKEVKKLEPVLVKALVAEIEQLKAMHKDGKYIPRDFDSRDANQCFLGQFLEQRKSSVTSNEYRKLVGTMYKNAYDDKTNTDKLGETLLELWGATHWKEHRAMVKAVASYIGGKRKSLPEIKFHRIYINIDYPKS